MKVVIRGEDAVNAAEDLLQDLRQINGIAGSYEKVGGTKKEPILTTIATIVGIVGGSIAIAEKLYEWSKKYRRSQNSGGVRIEKIVIILSDERDLVITETTTVKDIEDLLGSIDL